MEQKYTLSAATDEERSEFMKDLDVLAKKHLLYLEAIPTYDRIEGTQGFQTKATLLIQKMIPVAETEVVQEGAVPSNDPEVNPAIKDESDKAV